MPIWGNDAFVVRSALPGPEFGLNPNVVGKHQCYDNVRPSPKRLIVKLDRIGSPIAGYVKRVIPEPVDCKIDTGSSVSLFQSKVGAALELNPSLNVTKDAVKFTNRALSGHLSRQPLAFQICDTWVPVDVYFPVWPVDAKEEVYVWRHDFPKRNLLGTEGILSRYMLCVTPERLFVFSRKKIIAPADSAGAAI